MGAYIHKITSEVGDTPLGKANRIGGMWGDKVNEPTFTDVFAGHCHALAKTAPEPYATAIRQAADLRSHGVMDRALKALSDHQYKQSAQRQRAK